MPQPHCGIDTKLERKLEHTCAAGELSGASITKCEHLRPSTHSRVEPVGPKAFNHWVAAIVASESAN
jgi:hypothetical protein